jgi:hypothetical protein
MTLSLTRCDNVSPRRERRTLDVGQKHHLGYTLVELDRHTGSTLCSLIDVWTRSVPNDVASTTSRVADLYDYRIELNPSARIYSDARPRTTGGPVVIQKVYTTIRRVYTSGGLSLPSIVKKFATPTDQVLRLSRSSESRTARRRGPITCHSIVTQLSSNCHVCRRLSTNKKFNQPWRLAGWRPDGVTRFPSSRARRSLPILWRLDVFAMPASSPPFQWERQDEL